MTVKLDIQDLSWAVGPRLVLDSLCLDFPAGKVCGLVGPNGSGKSSLLRAIYGAVRPSAGRVRLDGSDLSTWTARRRAQQIAVVLQEFPTEFGLTVEQVVALGRTPHRRFADLRSGDDPRHVADALKATGAQDLRHRAFGSLSGGEKQRVLIARALAQSPRLLILDEPTNHLDIRHQLEVLELLRRLQVTVIVSLHDLNLAARYCDELHVLREGRLAASGIPAKVLTAALIAEVFGVAATITFEPGISHPQITFNAALPVPPRAGVETMPAAGTAMPAAVLPTSPLTQSA
jgi:iron complex transport system ATP-binding protein